MSAPKLRTFRVSYPAWIYFDLQAHDADEAADLGREIAQTEWGEGVDIPHGPGVGPAGWGDGVECVRVYPIDDANTEPANVEDEIGDEDEPEDAP